MQLTWVERAGETLCLLNHTTYHSQEANKIPCTTHNYAPRRCEGYQLPRTYVLGRQTTPSRALTLSMSWGCTLYVYHSAWSIHTQHSKLNSYEIRYKNPTCTLYLVTLWSGNNQSILWNAFNIGLSHRMVPMWTYVPKEVLHNSHQTNIAVSDNERPNVNLMASKTLRHLCSTITHASNLILFQL